MAEFVPQIPKSNSLRDRAIAAIIDRIRLRQNRFIYMDVINDWCKTYFCIDHLSAEEFSYISQETGLGILSFINEEEGD